MMKQSLMRPLFIIVLLLSIIILFQWKSYVPIASYFLTMAAITRIMIVEENQHKFNEQVIQNINLEQIDWIHKELNQVCESNDIEEIKKTLYRLDSKLYLLHHNGKGKGI